MQFSNGHSVLGPGHNGRGFLLTLKNFHMQLEQATRKKARIRLGLQGPSGSGKTYSALLLAYGLCSDWTAIAVIDTEYGSASLYSHLGPFKTIRMGAPFT